MTPKRYSHVKEREYYAQGWPQQAKPFLHLERYFRCWMRPEEVFRGRMVLDIGAGECDYSRLIAERFAPEIVVACELFPERMAPAAHANPSSRLRFVAGDCFRLPFRDRSFDVAFGSFILHQIPDLKPVVQELKRVLRDTGCYLGIEPNPLHPVHLYRYLRGRHSPNQYLFSPRDLAVFRESGFEVKLGYFYAKLPFLKNRFLGTCMGITARRALR